MHSPTAPPPPPQFLPGIDVSHYQENIDWPAVAASGTVFCFIKATEGSFYVDPRFGANWHGAAQAGILRSAFHFFHPTVPVTAQADLFLRTVPPLQPGDLPPVLDLEAPEEWAAIPALGRAPLVLKWLETVEARLHVSPIVYLSPAFMDEVLQNAGAIGRYLLWLADYAKKASPRVPKPWTTWTFWQYKGGGTAAGISKPVDFDWFSGTIEDLKALALAAPATLSQAGRGTSDSRSRGIRP